MTFKTRKDQIEKDFLPRCLKTPTRKVLKEELRGAAMVGACEERERTLGIIGKNCHPDLAKVLRENICAMGVLEVCGYPRK